MRASGQRFREPAFWVLLHLTWTVAACASSALATVTPPILAPNAAVPSPDLATAQDSATRLTVMVMINHRGPYPFVIDTAADRTVISRELAVALDLPAGAPARLHDTGGVGNVATAVIDSLSFGGREMHGIEAPTLAAAGLGAAGMLGIDTLHDQNVILDFAAKTFRCIRSHVERAEFDPKVVVVEGRRRFGQLVLVDAESRGTPVWVILDSGAQNTVGNGALRKLIALGRPGDPHRAGTEIISVTGRRTPAEVEDISEIRLGRITISHVPIAFAELHTFAHLGLSERPAMLLGMDVLSHFQQVGVDFPRHEAVFTTRRDVPAGLP